MSSVVESECITFLHLFSDNSKLCSCGGDRQIFYWDVATGRVIRKFRGHDGEVIFTCFNVVVAFALTNNTSYMHRFLFKLQFIGFIKYRVFKFQ